MENIKMLLVLISFMASIYFLAIDSGFFFLSAFIIFAIPGIFGIKPNG